MMKRVALAVAAVTVAASNSFGTPINTSDTTSAAYIAFITGATVQNFEGVSGLTPLGITAYSDGAPVPATAQMHGEIPGLFFHSGGANPNNTAANPGTPVALLSLGGGIAGDAHSATNVVAPLQLMIEPTDPAVLGLGAGDFLEIIFSTPVNRVGVWLNPGRGNAGFNAQDASLTGLESVAGTAGNFVGVSLPTDSIKVVSIIAAQGTGFTIDDLTYGTSGATTTPTPTPIPEPSTLLLFAPLVIGLAFARWRAQS
jgi:hypothetical protein